MHLNKDIKHSFAIRFPRAASHTEHHQRYHAGALRDSIGPIRAKITHMHPHKSDTHVLTDTPHSTVPTIMCQQWCKQAFDIPGSQSTLPSITCVSNPNYMTAHTARSH